MVQSLAEKAVRALLVRLCAAVAVACLWAACPAPALAVEDVFIVRDVKVDATAKTAASARDKALAEGQVRALARVFARIVLAADRARLPKPSPETAANLMRDFEISGEKTSAVRYLASMTVRFRADAIRAYLREYGVGFAETMSKPLVVLPVYEAQGALALWDAPNPWFDAWAELPPSDGLVPMILPKRDLRDVSLISADQALKGTDDRLAAIAGRYGAAGVIVAVAAVRVPPPGPGMAAGRPVVQVTVIRYGQTALEQTWIDSYPVAAGDDRASAVARAAAATARRIEETWKRANRLRFGAGEEITIDVPIAGLRDWLEVKKRLNGVSFVRRSDLIFISRDLVRLRVNFPGDAAQLVVALAQSDLELERGPTSWVLRLRGAGRSPRGSVSGQSGRPTP